jgi:hypothetical protein
MAAGGYGDIRCGIPLKEKIDFLSEKKGGARIRCPFVVWWHPENQSRNCLAW